MNCLGLNYEVKMVGAWNGMWALANCAIIDAEGVANSIAQRILHKKKAARIR